MLPSQTTVAQIDRTPLGLYLFSEDMAEAENVRARTWSGGIYTNGVMGHVAVTSLAFGEFGTSEMGSYKGRAGVDTFSHRRSTAIVPTRRNLRGSWSGGMRMGTWRSTGSSRQIWRANWKNRKKME